MYERCRRCFVYVQYHAVAFRRKSVLSRELYRKLCWIDLRL